MTALSVTRLCLRQREIVGGEILFRGSNLLALSGREMNRIRGEQISMIFQNPRASLNPLFRVEKTLEQVLGTHRNLSGESARRAAFELLRRRRAAAGARARALPARALGGHVPARDDRLCPRLAPEHADRRRADDRARRDDPAPDHRAALAPPARSTG